MFHKIHIMQNPVSHVGSIFLVFMLCYHKRQQIIDFINNQLRLERKIETKFTELNDAMREYHEVFGHELPPLPREPVLSDSDILPPLPREPVLSDSDITTNAWLIDFCHKAIKP